MGVAVLAAVAVVVILMVHARQLDRLKRLASIPPSAYVVEQSPSIVLDHVRVIDGSGAPAQEDQSIVIQGWTITDAATISEITATKPIPGHETVVRLPARMAPFLLEACGDGRTPGVRPAPLG